MIDKISVIDEAQGVAVATETARRMTGTNGERAVQAVYPVRLSGNDNYDYCNIEYAADFDWSELHYGWCSTTMPEGGEFADIGCRLQRRCSQAQFDLLLFNGRIDNHDIIGMRWRAEWDSVSSTWTVYFGNNVDLSPLVGEENDTIDAYVGDSGILVGFDFPEHIPGIDVYEGSLQFNAVWGRYCDIRDRQRISFRLEMWADDPFTVDEVDLRIIWGSTHNVNDYCGPDIITKMKISGDDILSSSSGFECYATCNFIEVAGFDAACFLINEIMFGDPPPAGFGAYVRYFAY